MSYINQSNDNLYILLFIICIVGLIIFIYKLWKTKVDKFNDILNTSSNPNITINDTQLDINQETIINNSLNTIPIISQPNITTNILPSNDEYAINNNSQGLLDTQINNIIGGIKTNLGYSILEDKIGTFIPNTEKQLYTNPNTYDNTLSYNTGINSDTINGIPVNKKGYRFNKQDDAQVFLQKDFAGVANIFAPNIYIENPPLNSDGYPNISFDIQ